MLLGTPSMPLITVDPYFFVWSPSDILTSSMPVHWTGHPNTILGGHFIKLLEYYGIMLDWQ